MQPTPPAGAKPHRGGFFRGLVKHRESQRKASEQGVSFDGAFPFPQQPHRNSQKDPQAPAFRATVFLERLTLRFLEKLWVAIKKNFMLSTNGEMDMGSFMKLARQQLPELDEEDDHFLEQLFARVDRRKRGVVKITDITTALILICREDPRQKMKLLFKVFDADDDGCVTPDEIFEMYFSIKCNDICKDRDAIQADIVFEDELSLQEAKRLYERTIKTLGTASDFITLGEFCVVFDEVPFVLKQLLPGAFTLSWILREYRMEDAGARTQRHQKGRRAPVDQKEYRMEESASSFVGEIKDSFVKALRRTDPALNLSIKRGRGLRIMQNCLDQSAPSTGGEIKEAVGFGGFEGNHDAGQLPESLMSEARYQLPKLQSASKKIFTTGKTEEAKRSCAKNAGPSAGRDGGDEENSDDDNDDDDDDAHDNEDETADKKAGSSSRRVAKQHASGDQRSKASSPIPKGPGGKLSEKMAKYSINEVIGIPEMPVHARNHKHARLFRTMKWDTKTEQAYSQVKQDANRTRSYRCLLCAENHSLQLSNRAEHQLQ